MYWLVPYLKSYNRDKRVQSLSRGVCGGGVKGIRLWNMGRGPGESVVHGPRTSLLRHCFGPLDIVHPCHPVATPLQMKIKWRHRQHCEWSRQQHVLLYVIKWQMIRFQALWKTKSFVKVCFKFKLPLWTKGLLIHLSPLWQLPLWHFPR